MIGPEAGRRRERVEWGLRALEDNFLHHKGHVEPRLSEEDARYILANVAPRNGWGRVEVVCRTLVTYTTNWSPVPAATTMADQIRSDGRSSRGASHA